MVKVTIDKQSKQETMSTVTVCLNSNSFAFAACYCLRMLYANYTACSSNTWFIFIFCFPSFFIYFFKYANIDFHLFIRLTQRPKEALIVARSHNSYEDFFGERLHTRMSSPVHIQGYDFMRKPIKKGGRGIAKFNKKDVIDETKGAN